MPINSEIIVNNLRIGITDDEKAIGEEVPEGMIVFFARSKSRWARVLVPKQHYLNTEVQKIAETALRTRLESNA